MHKFFAKPLFLGKKVVFLPQCHSTNSELARITRNSPEPEGMMVYTDHQINGRGQRGNLWLAEPGKNILMSILIRPKSISPQEQFYLNLITGLAIVDTLKPILSDELRLKWPNDVYFKDKKISGILIESNIRGSRLESAIVGIGLNVNQSNFSLQNASSLLMETNQLFNREELMESILVYFEQWYIKLKSGRQKDVLDMYHEILMWRDEVRSFRSANGEFEGRIIGINEHGNLKLLIDKEEKIFGIKEIEFIG